MEIKLQSMSNMHPLFSSVIYHIRISIYISVAGTPPSILHIIGFQLWVFTSVTYIYGLFSIRGYPYIIDFKAK